MKVKGWIEYSSMPATRVVNMGQTEKSLQITTAGKPLFLDWSIF